MIRYADLLPDDRRAYDILKRMTRQAVVARQNAESDQEARLYLKALDEVVAARARLLDVTPDTIVRWENLP